ncbi:MAG: molybdopterin-guanine dinucleotide biosynthesis protein B [Proteobacteria bacterium]|nr:molybdopterin-guanine dinucleotide biosynthesis protein B [Pseudomonadota bacterium]
MHILGISGWSGNGKTTLLTRLIPALIAKGFTVSTIKHAHHRFDIDKPGKDSYRHREAGAQEVVISSPNRWALMHENRDGVEASLDQLLANVSPVDFLLVEGFKSEDFPKIEVWREESGTKPRVGSDPTIIAIATPDSVADVQVPVLDLDDEDAIAEFIIRTFKAEVSAHEKAG